MKLPPVLPSRLVLRHAGFGVLLCAGAALPSASASVVVTWQGNSSTTLLDPANWVGGVAPVASNALQFGVAGSAGTSLTNPSNISFGFTAVTPAILFASGAPAYTIGGAGSIAIGTGGVTNASGQVQTFSGPARLNTGNTHTLTNQNSALSFGGAVELNQDTSTFSLGSSAGQSLTFGNNLVLGTVNPGNLKNLQLNGSSNNSTVTLNGTTNSGLTGTLRLGSNLRANIGSATGLSAATTVNFNGGNAQLVNTSGSALSTPASLAVTTTGALIFGQAGDTAANSLTFNGTAPISADLNRTITLNGTGLNVASGSVWSNSALTSRTLTLNGAGNTLALAGIDIGASGETANVTQTIVGSANLTLSGGVSNGLGTGTRSLQHNGVSTVTINGASNYSGTTGVGGSATLIVNGTHTGGGTYSIGGVLGGTGTIDLSASNGVVQFTSSGSNRRLVASSTDALTIIGGTTTAFNLTNGAGRADGLQSFYFTLGAPGTTVVDVQGLLNLGAGTLNFDDFVFTPVTGFGAGTYTLFDYASVTGSLGSSLSGVIGDFTASISTDAVNGAIVLNVIPEPSTWAALIGLGALGLAVVRRSRRA